MSDSLCCNMLISDKSDPNDGTGQSVRYKFDISLWLDFSSLAQHNMNGMFESSSISKFRLITI